MAKEKRMFIKHFKIFITGLKYLSFSNEKIYFPIRTSDAFIMDIILVNSVDNIQLIILM